MTYSKQTWTDGVSTVNGARMGHIEDGVEAADDAATTAAADAATVAGDLDDLSGVVDSKADVGDITGLQDIASAVGYRIWNGSTWSARPSGYGFVEAFSDGTAGSDRDPSAPAPTGAADGDRWWDAVS